MSNKNLLNIIYKRENSIYVGVRLNKNLVARIDEYSDNRSEFIRQAIIFYIKFLEFSDDILELLRKLGLVNKIRVSEEANNNYFES